MPRATLKVKKKSIKHTLTANVDCCGYTIKHNQHNQWTLQLGPERKQDLTWLGGNCDHGELCKQLGSDHKC